MFDVEQNVEENTVNRNILCQRTDFLFFLSCLSLSLSQVHVLKANADDSQQVQLTKSKCQKQANNLGGRLVGGATPVDVKEPTHIERVRLGLVGYESGKHRFVFYAP